MSEWSETNTVNNYTNECNKVAYVDGLQAIVYRRQWGWAYTVRAQLSDGDWLQQSSRSDNYIKSLELAQVDALAALYNLKIILGPNIHPIKEPEPRERKRSLFEVLVSLADG